MTRHRSGLRVAVALFVAAGVLSACGGGHRLVEYDFRGGTLAVVDTGTPSPVLLTGAFDVDASDDPVPADILTAGTLARVSVEDFRRILQRLADFSADAVTDRLRGDLREARRNRGGD